MSFNCLFGRGTSILMYHSIDYNKIFFTVKPEDFKTQMDWLYQKKYNVISLSKLVDIVKLKEKIPPKTLVLTFDDGFKDNYFNAFPILKKYNFPATIFLTTDFIGGEQKNESTGILFKTLDWSQTKEMHNSGLIDFEPHTGSHLELTKIPLNEAEKEILSSRRIIEEALGKTCYFFAYPRGKYNKEIINILKENNFLAALTVDPGRVKQNSELLKLPRMSIDSLTGRFQFLHKI